MSQDGAYLFDPNGWRKVVYIGHLTGIHGGKLWRLLLECGHTDYRSRPRQGIRFGLATRRAVALAPKKLKCRLCRIGLKAHPETIRQDMAAMDCLEAPPPL